MQMPKNKTKETIVSIDSKFLKFYIKFKEPAQMIKSDILVAKF